MAARLITPEEVSAACSELVQAGEQPSTVAVYKMLGKGSYSTIQKFITRWRESDSAKNAEASQLPAVVELPTEFVESGQLLLKKIFHLAEQQHVAKVDKIRAESDQTVAKAEEDVKEAITYSEEVGKEKDELAEHLADEMGKTVLLDEEIGGLKTRLVDSEREKSVMAGDAVVANEQIEKLLATVASLEKDVALANQATTSANNLLSELKVTHGNEIDSIKAEHLTVLVSAKTDYSTAIKDGKSAHSKAIKDLITANDKSTKTLVLANDKTIESLENSLQDAKSQRDSLSEKLDSIKIDKS